MLNKIELFSKELSYIETDWIRELTMKVINHIPDYFFEIPASSTGKYHPTYSLGKGGLLRHTQAACKLAHDVLHLEWFEEHFEKDSYSHSDFIIAALILHDSCKSGYPQQSKYTKHEHPLLAGDLIRDSLEVCLSEADIDENAIAEKQIKLYMDTVSDLISSHMGEWNTTKYSKEILPKPIALDSLLVHIFDYLASRKYINVDFEIE